MRFAPLLLLSTLQLTAQPGVEALVEKIEEISTRQERRLGLDTRITAAERLRAIAPAAARGLLERGLPALEQKRGGEPDYISFRLLSAYAAMDLDSAERALPRISDRAWAYTALLDQARRQQDFTRAIKLARGALKEGHYSLGAITFLIQSLEANEPLKAAELKREVVRRFPAKQPRLLNVGALLRYLTQGEQIDPTLGREAARKIFQCLDNPLTRTLARQSPSEETATYTIHDRKIETTSAYDTMLLPSAAFLAVFDAPAFRARASSLPIGVLPLPGSLPRSYQPWSKPGCADKRS